MVPNYLGPYTNAELAIADMRAAVARILGQSNEWPAGGNVPFAITVTVANQKAKIAELENKLEDRLSLSDSEIYNAYITAGFKVKPGRTDLSNKHYKAARAILAAASNG